MAARRNTSRRARPPLHERLDLRGGHEDRAGEEPHRAAEEEGRPEQLRADHDAPPGRRPQAPLPGDRLQAHARTASRRRSPRSSTTPTGRRASRCSTTPTARRPTSSLRRGSGSARSSSPARGGHQARQLAAAREHADGHAGANVELKPGQGAKMARSAGASVQLVAKDDGTACCACPRERFAACRSPVGPPSGRSATRITRTSRWQGGSQPLEGHPSSRAAARR